MPLKQGDAAFPTDESGPGGIRLGGLDQRMRERWRTVSDLWEINRQASTQLDLLGQIDYLHKLTSQLEWRQNPVGRSVRIVYTAGGEPTAALLKDNEAIVDERLYWVTCKSIDEANYLLSVINSDALAIAVNKYTTPNWAGNIRDLHKHLWKLPIPGYDPAQKLHVRISQAGERAAGGGRGGGPAGATASGKGRQADRDHRPAGTAGAWLRSSPEGAAVEAAVGQLLAG